MATSGLAPAAPMAKSSRPTRLVTGPTKSPVLPSLEAAAPLPKPRAKLAHAALRKELLELQAALQDADFPVLLVLAGVDGAGKGELANLFSEWMDPRGIATRAYDEPAPEEQDRPEFWRYWRDLPRRGSIGVFLSAWYHRPLLDKAFDEVGESLFEEKLARIRFFESTLAADGALILKFWMHLDRDQQKARFETLEQDPLSKWRVTAKDWKHWEMYDLFEAAAERILQGTGTDEAPWLVVDGSDESRRTIAVTEHIATRLREHLSARSARREPTGATATAESSPQAIPQPGASRLLAELDLTASLDKKTYRRELAAQQARLNSLYRRARYRGLSTVLVIEGWDAAGKGGAIRRLTASLDARGYRVISIAAPTEEELAHHYLWRFWNRMPRAGRVRIFDRSWYGRVLVERVEGFATPEEWGRSYVEINDFERQLTANGTVLLKFWFHQSPEEQQRRFEARAESPVKRWKLTEEDWRNRGKWGAYELAVEEMIRRTSTRQAPWILVEADDKLHARVKVLREVCERLERELG